MNQRIQADHRADAALIRLLCMASMAVAALTCLLPLAGSAAWWVMLLCLLPGVGVMALFRLAMTRTGAATLVEAVRAALGPIGAWALSWLLGALLIIDGTKNITALITLFTEGIGTRGTQFTLALLTSGVLLFCLHREGLPRAVYLLRWPMMASAALLLIFAAPDVRVDHLYPLLGQDGDVIRAALCAGCSLAWPLTLLLTVPPLPRLCRGSAAITAGAAVVGLLLALTLTVPQEIITQFPGLAQSLLLPVHFLPPAVRALGRCLLMLVLFLAIGASALLSTVHLCAPSGRCPGWLPYAVVGVLTLTQAGNVPLLWRILGAMGPWLLIPLAAMAVLSAAAAALRRRPS